VGLYALEFGAGCTDCTVERCELVDLGGGGMLIGTSGGPHSWGTPGRIDRCDLPPFNEANSRATILIRDAAPNLVPAELLAMQGR
jgi:hypothetical protein